MKIKIKKFKKAINSLIQSFDNLPSGCYLLEKLIKELEIDLNLNDENRKISLRDALELTFVLGALMGHSASEIDLEDGKLAFIFEEQE